ncbi:MAG: DUF6178 family protein [Vicinamibacterales bacterium]
MSTITRRTSAVRDGGSIEQRIARVLDSVALADVVPHLPPASLQQLVHHRGLDGMGEVLVAAAPAQLAALADLDLWRRSTPGADAQFDIERFGAWIEALVDAGPDDAARVVAALDTALVVAGLSRYVRVLDPGIFEPVAQSDDEAIARHDAFHEGDAIGVEADDWRDDRVEIEIGGYLVRARRREAWDAVVVLLVALDEHQPQAFQQVMRGCRDLSFSRPEEDGLDDLLFAPEQHAFDLEVAREARRSRQGYLTPADARAFLALARRGPSAAASPIAAAYLRAEEHEGDPVPPDTIVSPGAVVAVAELTSLLEAARPVTTPARLRLAAGDAPGGAEVSPTLVSRLMAYLRDARPERFAQRTRELAFLANALADGCSLQGRPFTAEEASQAAACACNLGIEQAGDVPEDWLVDRDLVAAFEAGWSALHRDVGLVAVDRLIAVLGDLRSDDIELHRDLAGLRRALVRHREAGAPWLGRGRVDVLAMLDPVAAVAMQGLLSECPVLPSALGAVIDGQTTAVDPAAFAFVGTSAQIGEIRLFLRLLPDLLAR